MKYALLLLTCLTVACIPGPTRGLLDRPDSRLRTTLEVTNKGMSPYLIFVNSFRLGSVYPGETKCFIIPNASSNSRLAAIDMDTRIVTPPFIPSTQKGWSWTLYENPLITDGLDVWPQDHSCK